MGFPRTHPRGKQRFSRPAIPGAPSLRPGLLTRPVGVLTRRGSARSLAGRTCGRLSHPWSNVEAAMSAAHAADRLCTMHPPPATQLQLPHVSAPASDIARVSDTREPALPAVHRSRARRFLCSLFVLACATSCPCRFAKQRTRPPRRSRPRCATTPGPSPRPRSPRLPSPGRSSWRCRSQHAGGRASSGSCRSIFAVTSGLHIAFRARRPYRDLDWRNQIPRAPLPRAAPARRGAGDR